MRLEIEIDDFDSLTAEEAIANIKAQLGADAKVSVKPINSTAEAHLYFGIQKLITKAQIEAFFDDGGVLYQSKVAAIREETLDTLEELVNKVIIHNENKVS